MEKVNHEFGGRWTVVKLKKLEAYLKAYGTIFSNNPKAAYFDTYYVDAFAGSGYRSDSGSSNTEPTLFDQLENQDLISFAQGSAAIALGAKPSLKNYVFIEKTSARATGLDQLKQEFPALANKIKILRGDGNSELVKWVRSKDWNKTRAVVFLDPYGLQVEWQTIKILGETKGVDLWLLFPFGTGVVRMLRKDAQIPQAWQNRLDSLFGTHDWFKRFYQPSVQQSLLGLEDEKTRHSDLENVSSFLVERLKSVFYKVHPHPYPLFNSRNNPLYLLCFASGNPKGAEPALKIAGHLLKPEK